MTNIWYYLCCCCFGSGGQEKAIAGRKSRHKNLSTLDSIKRRSTGGQDSVFKTIGTDPMSVQTEKISKTYEMPKDYKTETELLHYLGYSELEFIDAGSFGQVYRAVHLKYELTVAIKKIIIPEGETRKQRGQRTELMKDVKNELFTLENIYHPHVVKLIQHFIIRHTVSQNLSLYIIMQYAPGGTLSKFCESHGPLREEQCKVFFAQILSAMVCMKDKGIAHRDLKHSNILLDEANDALVSDFGTSRLVFRPEENKRIIESSTYCGTPPYMAPEILELKKTRKKYNAFQSDVWSLGVVLYKMYENRYPFSKNIRRALRQMKNKKLKFPIHPNPLFKDIIDKMFEYEPNQRLTLHMLAKHDWIKKTYKQIEERNTLKILRQRKARLEERPEERPS